MNMLARKTDSTLWFWGLNEEGVGGESSMPHDYSSPIQIPGTTWSSKFSMQGHALATKTDGTLWSWGYNEEGQLGQNGPTNADYSSPIQIPGTWSWTALDYKSSGAIKTVEG